MKSMNVDEEETSLDERGEITEIDVNQMIEEETTGVTGEMEETTIAMTGTGDHINHIIEGALRTTENR